MKFRLPALALALAFSVTACAGAPAAPAPRVDLASADPALWVAKDEDTTIYFFGTVHVLKPGTVWFDDEVGEAFRKSDRLVLEIVEPNQATLAAKMAGLAFNPAGPPLSERLDDTARAKYMAAMDAAGLPWQGFERLKPWMAAVFLAVAPLNRLGYASDLGAEKVLTAAARADGKAIGALETPEQQLGFFNSLPEDQQIAFLNATVDGMADVEQEFSGLVESWAAGEPDKLAEKMNESLEVTPQLAQALLFQRNENWAQQVKAMLDRPGTVFVAVGAGHLAGQKSLQDYLKALGIRTERVPHREK